MAENDNGGAAAGTTNGSGAGAKASKTEYETVRMADGREVQFAGKRKLDKTVEVDTEKNAVSVRFDLRNGQTISISSDDLNDMTKLLALGHGLSQKCGDEVAGVQKVEDMYLGIEEMIGRLKEGEWRAAAAAGDSFSGASIVIKAIAEVTGKTSDWIKNFLTKKLETAKAKGEKLSRADLYASFRDPNSDTGKVIQRLEQEERSKETKVKASDLLGEIGEMKEEAQATA
jgi:hypothetical protein